MIFQRLLRLKLIPLAKTSFLFLSFFLLSSCFGPIKEINYQIEDSMDDEDVFISDPKPLNEDFINQFDLDVISTISLDGESKRSLYISKFDNFLIYPSYDGKVSLVDFHNKIIIWTYKHTSKITAGSSFGDNKIYFVDYDGYLVALSIDGKLEWKSYVGEVFSPPLNTSNGVVVKDSNNKFFSLNQIDGSLLWDYKTPNSPLPLRSWGELTLSDEIIYAGISAGKVLALNSNNGTLIWENTFSPPKGVSEIERSNDTSSKVLVDEYAVYAVSSQGNIASIAKEDGVILWSRPMSSYIGVDINDQSIIVTHNSGSIYSLNKETKKINWRNSDLIGRDVSRPFIFDKFVVVSDYEGYLHFIDLNSGLIRARVKLADSNLLYPIIGEQPMEFIVVTLEGQVNVVSIKNSLLNDSQKNEEELKKQQNIENIESENDIKDNPETKEDSLIDTLIFWD